MVDSVMLNIKNTKYSNITHCDSKDGMEFDLVDFNKIAKFLPITIFAYEAMAVYSFHEIKSIQPLKCCQIYPLCTV